ncbi:MAG: cyclic nucleotide-binding domain-containing protein, partial [Chloroflexi bacterium]|nr:cyclic nucleotide-binding domain-containing protein [Chloroflexota bacterium]
MAETADQLTAANVASGWIEGFSLFVGPLATGVLLTISTPGTVFVVMAGVLLCSALLAGTVRAPNPAPAADGSTVVQDLMGGFSTLTHEPGPRLIVSLMGVNFLLVGALDIVLVVLAFRQLGTGSGGVGFLNAAFGAGGFIGAATTMLLVGRQRLAPPLALGALAWGLGLALLSAGPSRLLAPLLIVLAGAGRSVFDVTGRTLLQRVVPGHLMSRVFGILEGLFMGAVAAGLILIPALFAILHDRPSFVAAGTFLPVAMLLTWRRLREVDSAAVVSTARLALLRSVSIFSFLSPPIIEWLAARLIPLEAAPGTVIIRQGDRGDRLYVIAEGWVTVSSSGTTLARLGPGDYFGEIALLHDVPRTADVVAETSVELFALERADFLAAITGHPGGVKAMQAMSQSRVEAQRAERLANEARR